MEASDSRKIQVSAHKNNFQEDRNEKGARMNKETGSETLEALVKRAPDAESNDDLETPMTDTAQSEDAKEQTP